MKEQVGNSDGRPSPCRWKRYPKYKPSGVEWLGMVPEGWELNRLANIAQIIDPQPNHRAPTLASGDGFPYIGIRDINLDGSINIDTARIIEEPAVIKQEQSFKVDVDDIVFCKVGTLGEPKLIKPFGRFALSATLLLIKSKKIMNKFLFYYLSCDPTNIQLDLLSTGSTRDTIGIQQIRKFKILTPKFEEQITICSFLDRETARIDALIAKKERQIELLQEKRAALISHAVTKGLEPNAKMKDSGIEWLGMVPEGWEIKKIAWITKCLDGKRIPLNTEERGKMQGEYPYWGANAIVDYINDWLFNEPLVLLGEDGAPFFEKFKDVAFAVDGKIWVNNHTHVLRPKKIHYKFLAYALNSVDYRPYINGATRDKLTQSEMNSIHIQCPPLPEQHAIAAFLDRETARIDEIIEKIKVSIEKLNEYRSALISAAVTGKIDVRQEVSA